MNIKLLIAILFLSIFLKAQDNSDTQVLKTIHSFISAKNNRNLSFINKLVDRNIGLMTVFYDGRKTILAAESLEMFLESINAKDTIREVETDIKIQSSDVLATVWCKYLLYKNGSFDHCGENAYQLYKNRKGWKIIQITNTHRNKCVEIIKEDKLKRKVAIIKFLDNWHKFAAVENRKEYFNAIADDGIYIGTAPEEYWTKEEFYKWSEPYFLSKKTWNFEVLSRKITFADNKNLAWFTEKLNTGMGLCRASGIIKFTSKGWKIKYYHLAIPIPNKLIKGLLKLKKESLEKVND